jgi:glucose/arabinose dehydrogenase
MAVGPVIGREGGHLRLLLALVAAVMALAAAVMALAAAPGAPQPSASAGSIGLYNLEKVADFRGPVYADDNGVNANLLFVVEQGGRIRVVKGGDKKQKPFLDIRDQVESAGEQGLLSVAFAPDYATSGLFYVFYTTNDGDLRIDQFERGNRPTHADFSSRAKVIKVQHDQAANHNGGQLQFGPDGYLYASTGDGGTQMDRENDAQATDSLLGKILRLDPKPGGGYSVPEENPYVGQPGKNEIFALGLRNPWRFSFDSDTGALTIGDVGGTEWEEIDHVADGGLGANFGWNDYEGTHETTFGAGPNASLHTAPVAEFSHGSPDNFCAIIGGYVIHDPDLVQNEYIYSDYCDNELRLLQVPSGADGDDLGLEAPGIVSFAEGADGQIYTVSQDGPVSALEPAT